MRETRAHVAAALMYAGVPLTEAIAYIREYFPSHASVLSSAERRFLALVRVLVVTVPKLLFTVFFGDAGAANAVCNAHDCYRP